MNSVKQPSSRTWSRKVKLITHGDRTQTVKQWAAELGLEAAAINTRLRRGWPVDRALEFPLSVAGGKAKLITHGGRTQTVKQWAAERGLLWVTVYARLRVGWPVDQALESPPRLGGRKSKLLTHGGRAQTVQQWAAERGLAATTLNARLQRGWPVDQALGFTPRIGGRKTKLLTHGDRTQTVKQWAAELGLLDAATINTRLRAGWPVDRALESPPRIWDRKLKLLTYNHRTQTVRQWATERGLSATTLNARLQRGWPVDKALGFTPRIWGHGAKLITHGGRTQTVKQWAVEVGLAPATLKARLRLGWPVERALTAPLALGPRKSRQAARP